MNVLKISNYIVSENEFMINFTKRVIILKGKRTSIRLCENEWQILENICRRENMRRNALLCLIKTNKAKELAFTPAIRLFMLNYLHTLAPQLLFAQKQPTISICGLLNSMR